MACTPRLVTGVNLPMLLRAVNYRHESLDALVARAVAGGTQGVMQVAVTAPQNQKRRKPHDQNHTTISNKLGLHARASAKLTKLAGSFPCEVWISPRRAPRQRQEHHGRDDAGRRLGLPRWND
jgi:hypothetical protein